MKLFLDAAHPILIAIPVVIIALVTVGVYFAVYFIIKAIKRKHNKED